MFNLRRWLLLILLGAVVPITPSYAAQLGKDQQVLARLRQAYGKLPMSFEANQGQSDPAVRFLARGQGYTLFLKGDEAVLRLREPGPARPTDSPANGKTPSEQVLRMRFVGADPAALMSGVETLPGVSNYFIGKDPTRWRTNVPTYRKVKCESLYPGIDLVYYGTQGQMEYDLVLAPGARTENAVLHFEGGTPQISPQGDLVIKIGSGEVIFHKPYAYAVGEESSPGKQPIAAAYVLRAQNQVGFRLAPYDTSKTVVIDPILSYATYLGGNQGDSAYGIAVDASNQAYVVGATGSGDFPSVSPYQSANKGGVDVFVTKLADDGASLLFSTYLGGAGYDAGAAIAVDALGNAYVTGTTSSTDFPVTPVESATSSIGAFQTALGGSSDAFVVKLGPAGGTLVYSSFLGGAGADFGEGIAVDALRNAYVTGSTQSTNFPTLYPFQGGNDGNGDAFVTKVNQTGTALVYSTYLGGASADAGQGIAVDAAGRAYVAGYTFSTNFPTRSALQNANGGSADAFVAALDPDGLTLVYSTYLGGTSADRARAIALDASGNAYVTGETQSSGFPTTGSILQSVYAGNTDAFVAKLGVSGSALVYSTFLGGTELDQGMGIAVDSTGNAFVTGYTQSSNFPKSNSVQARFGGGTCNELTCPDAFVSELNPQGSALVYSTYLGGSGADYGKAICVDSDGYTYVAGSTSSTNFTPTAGTYQAVPGDTSGAGDAFVVRIDPQDAPRVALTPQTLNFDNQAIYTASGVKTVTLTNVGTLPLVITDITTTGDFTETNNCIGTIAPSGGFCTISVTFTPTALLSRTEEITITNNEEDSPHTIIVNGTGINPTTSVVLSPSSLTFGNQSVDTTSPAQTVTLTNTGDIALEITDIAVTGDFAQTNTCPVSPATLAAGANCRIFVAFTPTTTGTRSGSVTITDNAGSGTQAINLTGTGIAGFSIFVANPSKIITIGNASTTFIITATGPADYTGKIYLDCESGPTCTFNPSYIYLGESSTLTVSDLTADTANPFDFTVEGTNSDGTETATLSLSIFFADYTVSATPNLNSVAAGASAVYKVHMTPANGFSQAVLFSCDESTLPDDAECVFSPSAVASTDGVTVMASTLTITTTARSGVRPLGHRHGAPPASPGIPMLVSVLCLLTLLLAALRITGSRSPGKIGDGSALRGRALLTLATLLLVLMGLSMSCSNTYSNLIYPTKGSGSQIGNYTITINGELGGGTTPVNRTTTVNLAVS